MPRLAARWRFLPIALAAACASPPDRGAPTGDTLTVFAASSLAEPMGALRDTFARGHGVITTEEHGASLELARRITELHRVPDVVVLADEEVFPQQLQPAHAGWYARFARNHMVIAYTARSRHASTMSAATWRDILLRDDVLVGRADPGIAPAGYRALLTFQLAERFYHQAGLAERLAMRSPPRLQRANAAELAALLEAGELDYIVDYESLARTHHLQWLTLPAEIDLGDPSRAPAYALARVRVKRGADSVTVTGAPIVYGVSVPRAAPHSDLGARFVALLLGDTGRAVLRAFAVEPMDHVEFVGDGVPAMVRAAAAR